MSSGQLPTLSIDDRLESYTTFFDHAWAKTIDDLAVAPNWKYPSSRCASVGRPPRTLASCRG